MIFRSKTLSLIKLHKNSRSTEAYTETTIFGLRKEFERKPLKQMNGGETAR